MHDRMLDMGFSEQVYYFDCNNAFISENFIGFFADPLHGHGLESGMKRKEDGRQTLIFSATSPRVIQLVNDNVLLSSLVGKCERNISDENARCSAIVIESKITKFCKFHN
jgi:superfamily II DNA/RNA helicase